MCYDISYKITLETLEDYFGNMIFDDPQINLNFDGTHIMGHSYGLHPIIYRNRVDQEIHCKLMEWGVIPFYEKDKKEFTKIRRSGYLNARSERIWDDKKSYWYKIRDRRCLIPVNGTYEHRKIKGWKNKVPYYITLKNYSTFFLPGLYSIHEYADPATGEDIKSWTYTLITRPANSLMKNIHNDGENAFRMPLFLPFEKSLHWINHDLPEAESRDVLNFEMPSGELEYKPVFSIRSSKLRTDNKPKNEYWEWEKLPALGEMNP